MSIYRSEAMGYYNIHIERQSAWYIVNELGKCGCIQFEDRAKESAFHLRTHYKEILRARETITKLQSVEDLMKRYDMDITKVDSQEDLDTYLTQLDKFFAARDKEPNTYLDEVEQLVNTKGDDISNQLHQYEETLKKYNHLFEFRAVLRKGKECFGDNNTFKNKNLKLRDINTNPVTLLKSQELKIGDVEAQNLVSTGFNLNFMAGVIDTEDKARFVRMVFRATKGNIWTTYSDFLQSNENDDGKVHEQREDVGGDSQKKTIFICVYQGGNQKTIEGKLNRIADSFGAHKFSLPTESNEYVERQQEIESELNETLALINMTRASLIKKLQVFGQRESGFNVSYVEQLHRFLVKEIQIYENINMLRDQDHSYNGYFWCPDSMKQEFIVKLEQFAQNHPNIPKAETTLTNPGKTMPPTYFRLNAFTGIFQLIVDTYGIARYQEVNPGLFAVAMFPFKFGVMFGDIGHGGLLLIVGLYMVLCNRKLIADKSPLAAGSDGRYLFMLMGWFAFYSGWMYNDFFSMPINAFGSCWENEEGDAKATLKEDCVYPFGIDPKWYVASNELAVFNSLKMKLAVIIGVCQMMIGVCLKGCNCVFFKDWLGFFFEFIPQIFFMTVTFGFMDALIFIKWNIDYRDDTEAAPAIINQMINLPLAMGSTGGTPLWNTESQETLQFYFLCIALICVPIMLLVKPLCLFCMAPKKEKSDYQEIQETLVQKQEQGGGGHEDDIGEIFVHQVIETIEFVLGSISNTASYLRLWALSLAHSQLAKVFFEKTLGSGLTEGSLIGIFIGWALWIHITLAVIMCMDLMECFLHALRLQWVEFQNKFYKADGYKFKSFSHQDHLKEDIGFIG